jgi:HEPN domain-containing protein
VEEAGRRGLAVEELVADILSKALNITLNPQDRAELHLELAERLLAEAEELVTRGDYVQVSEEAWRAVAHVVKALAAREGRELRSYRDLWVYVDDLSERLSDRELRLLWRTANSLHQNFYENWMPPRDVRYAVEDVKRLTEKLKRLTTSN